MKNKMWKQLLSVCLVGTMAVAALAGCGNSEQKEESVSNEKVESSAAEKTEEASAGDDKPDTWIADRTITIQTFVNDVGYSMHPNGVENTRVSKELEARTGIRVEWKYTPGDSDASVMMAQLAAGNIPDVIFGYMNNSTRPEYPIAKKAADEGVFADVSEIIKDTEVWSQYLEEGYLGLDAWNIINDPDWEGAIYFLPLSVDKNPPKAEWDPGYDYVGGTYIRADIAEDLGIDVKSIDTSAELYDLLVQIKEAGYVDVNGQPISPLGPRIWGGNNQCWELVTDDLRFADSNNFGVTKSGEIVHEAETDAVYDIINYWRKLIDEDLVHPEFFTIDESRSRELAVNKSVGIIADIHNYSDEIYKTEDWIPLGPIADALGQNYKWYGDKTQYGYIAISAEAENPEEIMQWLDYLCSYEAQLLIYYGFEGESYEMVDGNPVLTDKARWAIAENDTDYLEGDLGAAFDGQGFRGYAFMLTNIDHLGNFGENYPGAGAPDSDGGDGVYARAIEIGTNYARERKYNPGLGASAYLNNFEDQDIIAEYNLIKDTYADMVARAIYADNDEEVVKIVESFRQQLKASGIEEIEAYLQGIYDEDPNLISFTHEGTHDKAE